MSLPYTTAGRKLCAIVPAAGRGSRLAADVPKVFVPISSDFTVWDVIHENLLPFVSLTILVLSPGGLNVLKENVEQSGKMRVSSTVVALQELPLGMGDAIFGCSHLWEEFDDILIVWGDQFNLSSKTIAACLSIHADQDKPSLTIPLVRVRSPYVEYIFNSRGVLTEIRQSREGDICSADGWSDVGVFILSGGSALIQEWIDYSKEFTRGEETKEINFLPFLVYLSTKDWTVGRYEVADASEARGINTPEDLAFARELFSTRRARL